MSLKATLRYRVARLGVARWALRRHKTVANVKRVNHWRKLVDEARGQMDGPTIYRGADTGIKRPAGPGDRGWFGELGPIHAVTVHHAAGPRARTHAEALRLNGRYDAEHRAKGWGGLGYHETIDDEGALYVTYRGLARLKGAHTGGFNTGNYGILLHGNFEAEHPTEEALRTLRWRLAHGHEVGLADLRGVPVKGHCEWPPPGGSTACPGRNLLPHVRAL